LLGWGSFGQGFGADAAPLGGLRKGLPGERARSFAFANRFKLRCLADGCSIVTAPVFRTVTRKPGESAIHRFCHSAVRYAKNPVVITTVRQRGVLRHSIRCWLRSALPLPTVTRTVPGERRSRCKRISIAIGTPATAPDQSAASFRLDLSRPASTMADPPLAFPGERPRCE